MRIAFVDTLFSWPPRDGAEVDLYHVADGLQRLGHDIHLFAAHLTPAREHAGFDPAALPFPATRLIFQEEAFSPKTVPGRFREVVDAWKPDMAILGCAFLLKPHLIEALAHYPLVNRYYAYELLCPRDHMLFKDSRVCPNDYLSTPDACRRCTVVSRAADIKSGLMRPWARDYLSTQAYRPDYHVRLCRALRQCRTIIVSNGMTRDRVAAYHDDIRVFPGGVDVDAFQPAPRQIEPNQPKRIVMVGRSEDPAKGLVTLLEAGDRMARRRNDFVIQVTLPQPPPQARPWFQALPWKSAGVHELYQQADVCVVPSIWPEPFGLVAVEAMACGRPVCASRVGGLQDIVRDGETGVLVPPGDAAALSEALERLLDDETLRARMGEAGRRRVEAEYAWPRLIERCYAPLIEELVK